MEELTTEEIIKYIVRVQQDSFIFYRKAGKFLIGNQLKRLTDRLADNSADLLMRLKDLLSQCFIDGEDLSTMQDVDTAPFADVLENWQIPFHATPKDLLYLSLERENQLKRTYEVVCDLPLSNERVRGMFQDLKKNAESQVTSINKRLDSFTSFAGTM